MDHTNLIPVNATPAETALLINAAAGAEISGNTPICLGDLPTAVTADLNAETVGPVPVEIMAAAETGDEEIPEAAVNVETAEAMAEQKSDPRCVISTMAAALSDSRENVEMQLKKTVAEMQTGRAKHISDYTDTRVIRKFMAENKFTVGKTPLKGTMPTVKELADANPSLVMVAIIRNRLVAIIDGKFDLAVKPTTKLITFWYRAS